MRVQAPGLFQDLFGFGCLFQSEIAETEEGPVEGTGPGFVQSFFYNPGCFLEHPPVIQLDGEGSLILGVNGIEY